MNKKGFTLIEVLACLVILAVLLILFIPSVSDIFNKGKQGITEENIKTVEESAKLYLTDIVYCDQEAIKIAKNYINNNRISSCEQIKEYYQEAKRNITVEFLINNNYLIDDGNNFSKDTTIQLYINNDYSLEAQIIN